MYILFFFFTVPISSYQQAIKKLTEYIETLFLKEIGKMEFKGKVYEDLHTSFRTKSDSRGNKGKDTRGKTESAEGQGDTSGVHISTRGNQQTKSVEPGATGAKVADSNDSPSSTKD